MSSTRTRPQQNRFTGGVFAPEMFGRTDLEQYYGACQTLENFLLMPTGGVTRRPGSRYVATAKALGAHDEPPRLIDFQYSDEQAYVLEFGDRAGAGYVRFYRNGAQILGTPTGLELVLNGDFPADLTSWTSSTSGTGATSVASAKARLAAGTGSAAIKQQVTVVAGTFYVLSFELYTATCKVRVGSTDGADDIYPLTAHTAEPGPQTLVVESPTTAMWIEFVQDVPSTTNDLDNVSLMLAGPLEIAAPYLAADLPALMYAQSADTMYLAHPLYAPRKLTRTSHTSWRLREVAFRPPATSEEGHTVTVGITLSAVTGTGVTATASASFWIAGDDGRQLVAGDGRAVITGYTSATEVTVDILDDFASTAIASNVARLQGSPVATLTPTPAANIKSKGADITLTATTPASAFRSLDVGKYVYLHDGVVKIKTVASVDVATAEVMVPLEASTGTTDWTMEEDAWSESLGFPAGVGFSPGDRLCWGRDEIVWGSVVGDYENIGVSTLDAAAFEFGLRTSKVSVVRWLVGTDELYAGTSAGPFELHGTTDEPLSPTNVDSDLDVLDGCAAIRPVVAGSAILYVDDTLRALREFVFDLESDRNVAPDMLLLARHLFPKGTAITATAYQRSPHSILWVVRDDGALLGFTYMRPEKVTGWHQHPIGGDGLVRSVCVIPHWDGGRDVLWLLVERTVNMQTVYYVEYLDDDGAFYEQLNLDSALTYEGTATDVVTGLDHLEGETVSVVGDGFVLGDEVVTGGQITIDRECTSIEVGLPYTSTLVTLPLEIPSGAGTSAGVQQRIANATVRLLDTGGAKVGGWQVPFRRASDDADAPTPLFTGKKRVQLTGWGDEATLTVEQDLPLPCTVLMVAPLVGTGA